MKSLRKSEDPNPSATSAAEAANVISGADMMASVKFERTDLVNELKSRGNWMLQVIRFMRLRG